MMIEHSSASDAPTNASEPGQPPLPETPLATRILDAYWAFRLAHGRAPASVYALCKEVGIAEREFFSLFSSLDTLEALTWKALVTETIATLEADGEYGGYPARQKLLAFFFTFFELALGQRSRLLLAFPRFRVGGVPAVMEKAQKVFFKWADCVVQEGIDAKEFADRKRLSDRYPNLLFGAFWFLVDYNLKDESDRFEDTDALIEKTVNTFCDGARSQVFDSAFDLAKFLIGRSV